MLLLSHYEEAKPVICNLLRPLYAKEGEEGGEVEIYINRMKLKPYLEQLQESIERGLFKMPKQEISAMLK